MSSNIENEYFCDGLTEEIINALAKIKQVLTNINEDKRKTEGQVCSD